MKTKASISFLFLFFVLLLGKAHAQMPLGWAVFYLSIFLTGFILALLLLAGLPKYIIATVLFKKYIIAQKKTHIRIMIVESVIILAIFLANGFFHEKSLLQIINKLSDVSDNLALLCFSIFIKNAHLFAFLVILFYILPIYLVVATFINLKLFKLEPQEHIPLGKRALYAAFLSLIMPVVITLCISLSSVFMNLNELLIEASTLNLTKLSATLVHKGANVNAINKYGESALFRAFSYGEPQEMVRLLIENGADVNARNKNGMSVLMWASCGWERLEAFQVLLDKGADVNAEDKDGKTALMWAFTSEQYKKAELLLNKGADINAIDNFNRTALMDASGRGDIKTVRFLLDKGADIHIKNECGTTALKMAMLADHQEIAELLLKSGGNPADMNKTIQPCVRENKVFQRLEMKRR